jgi:deoxyribonuclease-4
VNEDDMAKAKQIVQTNNLKIFVHSPYIINLCAQDAPWSQDLLKKNLRIAKACGFKGVVVHVGKSTDQNLAIALETMRKNIVDVLEEASVDCPLLLETPAGQGTETLTKKEDFLNYILSFKDERLRVCVDTCHVFATGYCPLDYLRMFEPHPKYIRLVHFNDSLESCGSCKDRHAFIGSGKIGIEKMTILAEFCVSRDYPMIVE